MDTWINLGLYVTYVLIGICVLGILIFSIARIISHPGAAKAALIGIVGLIVLFGLSYALSNGDDVHTIFSKLDVSEETSRLVGTGLLTFYLLMGVAILSIIYVEITRLFKKNG